MSPGCCGKFFHQTCINQLIASGNVLCPNCRAPFPSALLGNPAPLMPPPVPMQMQMPLHMRTSSRRLSDTVDSATDAKRIKAEEDLIPDVVKPTKAAVEAEVGGAGAGTGADGKKNAMDVESSAPTVASIAISCNPEKNEISLGEITNFFVNVNLKASETVDATSAVRMPMDIVCVLDNSGSMQGAKIRSLILAMEFVRSQLTPEDRLSIITFNSTASLTHGLFRMTNERKVRSGDLCNAIRADGGTSIYSGMCKARDVLENRQTRNQLSCIFLLTDGQDGSNKPEKMALGREMRARGQSMFVFGFGADHDAAQLQEIANACEGSFSYVEADDMLTDAFGGAIGGQQGTVATNLQVTLQVPASATGVRLVSANAGRYTSVRQPNGSYLISYANIFAGEQRDVLAVVSIPATTSASASFPLLTASGTYSRVDGSSARTIAVAPVEFFSCLHPRCSFRISRCIRHGSSCHICRVTRCRVTRSSLLGQPLRHTVCGC